MAELDETTRHDLARLRERSGPDPGARDRMWSGIETKIGAGVGAGLAAAVETTASAASPAGQLGFVAKVAAATLGLAGAGLLTLRIGVVATRAITPQAEPAPSERHAAANRPAASDGPARTSEPEPESARDPVGGPDPELQLAGGPLVEPGQHSDSEAATKPDQVPSPEPGPDPQSSTEPGAEPSTEPRTGPSGETRAGSSLAAELALLEAARPPTAPKAALASLESHRERYPDGQLAAERELMRVEALCALGRRAQARAATEVFLADEALAAHHPRMRAICPDPTTNSSGE